MGQVQYRRFQEGSQEGDRQGGSPSAGTLEILQDDNIIATVDVPADRQFVTVSGKVSGAKKGIHHLKVRMATAGKVQVDWLTFE